MVRSRIAEKNGRNIILYYGDRGSISTEENEVQASIGDELVDQQPLLLLQADADEPDEILVLQLGHQRELVLQLLHSLRRAL